jgi:hypothetical protein
LDRAIPSKHRAALDGCDYKGPFRHINTEMRHQRVLFGASEPVRVLGARSVVMIGERRQGSCFGKPFNRKILPSLGLRPAF